MASVSPSATPATQLISASPAAAATSPVGGSAAAGAARPVFLTPTRQVAVPRRFSLSATASTAPYPPSGGAAAAAAAGASGTPPPKLPSRRFSSPRTKQSQDAFAEYMSQEFGIREADGQSMFMNLVRKASLLGGERNTLNVSPTGTLPRIWMTAGRCAVVFERQVGHGAQTKVFRAKVFPRGASPAVRAVKERQRRPKRAPPSPSTLFSPRRKGVDRNLAKGTTSVGSSYTVNNLYESSLRMVDFTKIPDPALFLLVRLPKLAENFADVHARGYVVRDLKGDNILCNAAEGLESVALTDFDDYMPQQANLHPTLVTPAYADPAIWDSLKAQSARQGVQTAASDQFAFGRTVEGSVRKLLKDLAGAKGIDFTEQDERIVSDEVKFEGVASDAQLDALEARFPGRCINRSAGYPIPNTIIWIYKDLGDRYAAFDEMIAVLQDAEALTVKQVDALRGLLQHALFDLQTRTVSDRKSAAESKAEFERLLAVYQAPEQAAPTNPS